ncbi:MAG: multicopper oxidase domain-containing protein [Deltaproteobacteria bacterium]|nr:multicopper oxidase domain-containing protein [Deltaproteobacteria bacterium]
MPGGSMGCKMVLKHRILYLVMGNLLSVILFTTTYAETKEFILTVTDGKIELNGIEFMVWKYNGVFPGPEIRVKEGDVVRVKLRNESGAKHGLFFHGLHVNPRVALQEQEIFVDPGYEYTYGEFIAKPAGTHLYHCSWNMAEHMSRGMYGTFIVEAKEDGRFDREFVYILSDWSSKSARGEGHHEVGHPRAMMDRDITTINDRVVDANNPTVMDVKEGERVRIRLANIGFLPHTIGFSDGFVVTHEDGYPLPELKGQDSLTIYPGKRYDITVFAKKVGRFPLYHSITMPKGLKERLAELEGSHQVPAVGHQHGSSHPSNDGKGVIFIILDVKGK